MERPRNEDERKRREGVWKVMEVKKKEAQDKEEKEKKGVRKKERGGKEGRKEDRKPKRKERKRTERRKNKNEGKGKNERRQPEGRKERTAHQIGMKNPQKENFHLGTMMSSETKEPRHLIPAVT